ncbi:MAG TPA: PLP-dependent aminotransferase family protein [Aliidongia sp.]|uniref:aminotransferase-like domain-containing protein n=1 Tax=Aliidongia sp. TaxID=1914230 RepID=UPI002DDD8107|nr:PLP-dependent aminotransferase family protein [Aliidongia sp.]HEV2675859.1 PLP-dependent aminotransferase family protein [Aliidongia sp.]
MTQSQPDPLAHLYARRADGMKASEIRELLKLLEQPDIISFAGGIPDAALFPTERVDATLRAILGAGTSAAEGLQYSVSEGYGPLRAWIAGYMRDTRGVECSAHNILITAGSQQALDLIGKLFVSPGDIVLTERPTYLGFIQSIRTYEPDLRPLVLDDTGASVPDLADGDAVRARLAYLIPDFANPTGRTLSRHQRSAALALAGELDVAVLEDAAYADLGHEGQRNGSLLKLDCDATGSIDASRVLYCGTFSKVFAPGLRIGWICAAGGVIDKLVLVKQASDLHVSTLNQMVMERLAVETYDAQIVRNRHAYAERKGWMVEALTRHLPQDVRWVKPDGGMFVWLELPSGFDGADLLAKAISDYRVAFVPGAPFYTGAAARNTIRLSFSQASRDQIVEGVKRLGDLITVERARIDAEARA